MNRIGVVAAEKSRIREDWIDDKGKPLIIFPQRERDFSPLVYQEGGGHLFSAARDLLVGFRLVMASLTFVCVEQKVAVRIYMHALHAFERHTYSAGARAGRYDEVVLKLLLIAVVYEVYSAVDVLISDLGITGDVRAPLAPIIADEVVAFARQLLDAFYQL